MLKAVCKDQMVELFFYKKEYNSCHIQGLSEKGCQIQGLKKGIEHYSAHCLSLNLFYILTLPIRFVEILDTFLYSNRNLLIITSRDSGKEKLTT